VARLRRDCDHLREQLTTFLRDRRRILTLENFREGMRRLFDPELDGNPQIAYRRLRAVRIWNQVLHRKGKEPVSLEQLLEARGCL
jgi:hypothetical protein